jgi:hypothetical protein
MNGVDCPTTELQHNVHNFLSCRTTAFSATSPYKNPLYSQTIREYKKIVIKTPRTVQVARHFFNCLPGSSGSFGVQIEDEGGSGSINPGREAIFTHAMPAL